MNEHIVSDALKYFDQCNEKYKHIVDSIKYWHPLANEAPTDTSPRICIFMDGAKKEVFRSRVEILGRYNNFLWEWGWCLADMPNSYLKTIRTVLLYGIDIDTFTHKKNIFLKSELTTSHYKITDVTQIEIHCAIAMYLAKKKLVIPVNLKKSTIDFSDFPQYDTYYMFIMDPPDVTS
jgi:hypothetical protein